MKTIQKLFRVPIYEVDVVVCASEEIDDLYHRKYEDFFGEWDDTICGLTCMRGSDMGLFFQSKNMTANTIAHEVFHATHFIMQKVKQKFMDNNHEEFAYLNGYLMEEVLDALGRRLTKKS